VRAPDPALVDDLVVANHILYAEGVVDGFGHISARDPERPDRFLLARSMAPALVEAGDIMAFDLDGAAQGGDARAPYLERFIHGALYKARPDVMAVVHSHSPSVIPFGVTGGALRPIYHMSGFLGGGAPIFEIRDAGGMTDLLIRDNALGDALARTLGPATVALMRGHGSVAVGTSIRQVVYRAIYTEMNARLQMEAARLGAINFLAPEEARLAAATIDGVLARPWELWKRKVAPAKARARTPAKSRSRETRR
jgi:ribulose-5-phosphate 4-epimerase/fuculose-1-phosphate aldolase